MILRLHVCAFSLNFCHVILHTIKCIMHTHAYVWRVYRRNCKASWLYMALYNIDAYMNGHYLKSSNLPVTTVIMHVCIYNIFPTGCLKVQTTGAQTFSCDASLSTPLCPGTIAQCTCEVRGMTSNSHWTFSGAPQQCPGNIISLPQSPPCAGRDFSSSSCGPHLRASNAKGEGYCHTSILDITAAAPLDGVNVTCQDMAGASQIIGSITLRVVGKCNIENYCVPPPSEVCPPPPPIRSVCPSPISGVCPSPIRGVSPPPPPPIRGIFSYYSFATYTTNARVGCVARQRCG